MDSCANDVPPQRRLLKVLIFRLLIHALEKNPTGENSLSIEKYSSGHALRPLEAKAADTWKDRMEMEIMGWKKSEAEPLNMERRQPGSWKNRTEDENLHFQD